MVGIGGVAAAALVALSYLSSSPRRRPRLIHRPSRLTMISSQLVRYLVNVAQPETTKQQEQQRLMTSADSPELVHLQRMHKLLDIVEQFVLPLSCQGVVYGSPPHGAAIVHSESLALVVAASSEEHANPLHVPECLAIGGALEPQSSPASPPLAECLLLTTHSLSSLAREAVAASGIRTVYVLFPETPSAHAAGAGADAAAASPVSRKASPTTPPHESPTMSPQRLTDPASPSKAQSAAPESPGMSGQTHPPSHSPSPCPFTVSAFVDVVGPFPPGRRMFESQEEMERSLQIDSLKANVQTRLLVISSIYQRLAGETEASTKMR